MQNTDPKIHDISNLPSWQKPELYVLSVKLTSNEDCTNKNTPGLSDARCSTATS